MIKFKTPVDNIRYTLPVRKINIYVENEEIKEFFIDSSPVFEPLTLTVVDEVDIKNWLSETYNISPTSVYKKVIEVEDKQGNVYMLHGCFPINNFQNKITVVFDYFTVRQTVSE